VQPRVLAVADDAPALPRLGGMARPDGVVIVSERYWAHAGRDGTLREGTMPQPPRLLRRVPLFRGLVRIAASLTPLFRGTGVAGPRERALLVVALLAPCLLVFAPERIRLVAGVAITFGLLAWLLRGRTLSLHGAEHRAIAAAEARSLAATWAGRTRPSRFSPRCGTNFAALVFPVAAIADRLLPLPVTVWSPVAVSLVALGATMELWQVVQASERRGLRLLLLPGLGLQRLTTREPSIDETRIALSAVASVLRRELS
jgi:Protein of unknown function (DUF1385)